MLTDGMSFFNYQVLLGYVFILLAFIFKPEILKIDREFVKKWMTLIFIFFVSNAVVSGLLGFKTAPFIKDIWMSGINSTLAVFWEEGLFVLPYVWLYSIMPKKKFLFVIPIMIVSSLLFAVGHAYQGNHWYFFAIVPFLSFWLSIRKGLITSMALHVFYDIIVICSNFLIISLLS